MINIYEQTKKIINAKEFDRKKQGEIFTFEPKKNDKVILVIGLNPGGKEEQKYNGILYFPKEVDEKLFNILKEEKNKKEGYIFPRYYKPLYDMITSIDNEISMFWTSNKEETKSKLKKMLEEKCNDNKKLEDYEETFEKVVFKNEKNKYMIFGDLFYYHTVNHKELKNILTEDKEILNKYIENIMDYFVKEYKPNVILVNSTFASEKIQDALYEGKEKNVDVLLLKKENNKYKLENYNEEELIGNIPIIFTADMTQYLDRLSKNRLKRQIKNIWEKVTI